MWPHNNSTAIKYSFFVLVRLDAKIRDETKTHVIRDETKTEITTVTLLAKPRRYQDLKWSCLSRRLETRPSHPSLEDYITDGFRQSK